MHPKQFDEVLRRIAPFTQYLYLHVLGEPMLHPHFGELLRLAFERGFKVNLTTNGSLLSRLKVDPVLLRQVRQYNFSLHDAAENIPADELDGYLQGVCDFVKTFKGSCYFSLRLWNAGADGVSDFNRRCLAVLSREFGVPLADEVLSQRCTALSDGVYLKNAARFKWPGQTEPTDGRKACYALRDHIAILSDGSIVPCCLDADAQLCLGNIFTDDLRSVLSSPKAVAMRSGFLNQKAVEPLCRQCGFVLDK